MRAKPEIKSIENVSLTLTIRRPEYMRDDWTPFIDNAAPEIFGFVDGNNEPVIEVIEVSEFSDQESGAQPLPDVIILQPNPLEESLQDSSMDNIPLDAVRQEYFSVDEATAQKSILDSTNVVENNEIIWKMFIFTLRNRSNARARYEHSSIDIDRLKKQREFF